MELVCTLEFPILLQPSKALIQQISKWFSLVRYAVGLRVEPFHFHQLIPMLAFQSIQPASAGGRRFSPHRIEWRIKDFPLDSSWRENPNSKMVYGVGVCRSYFHIYADILLNLLTAAQRKFNLRIALCEPGWAVCMWKIEWVMVGTCSGATAILKGELIVCFIYTKQI